MGDSSDLERRIARLEAESAIRGLVARYCFAIDDRDLDTVATLFCRDARFRSRDGVMDAQGRDAIIRQFEGRYAVLGAANHITHDHAITFDPADPDQASGQVSAHAELWRKGQAMVTALRYADRYRKEDGVWRFAERVLSFLYYAPVDQYAAMLGTRDRNRAYAEPRPADYPEALPTWKDYD